MTTNVQIPAGEDSFIQAVHSRPTEDSSAEWDSLLVIMMHGFPGNRDCHGKIFHDLEFLLRDKGYHTLRFDFRGCGDSGGREEDFTLGTAGEDLRTVTGWAKENGYRRFVTVGEGLGACVPLLHMEAEVACAVMLWPLIDLPVIARTAFKIDRIEPENAAAGYAVQDGHRIGLGLVHELLYTDMKPHLDKIACPVLVMHGVADEISPIDQIDLLREGAENCPRVEITSFQDGVHGLPQLNHRKVMYFHITQFIEKYS